MNWNLNQTKSMNSNSQTTEQEYQQVRNGKCPHCKGELTVPHGMLFFKGLHFSKLICSPCDKEWTNPKDVMLDHAEDVMEKEVN